MNAKHFSSFVSLLYHIACFCGLTLQIIQISVNYFKYETVSSINVVMPGREDAKAINICFRSDEVYNYTRYTELSNFHHDRRNDKSYTWDPNVDETRRMLFNTMFTISERFYASLNFDYIFNTQGWTTIKFIYHRYVCYHTYGNDIPGSVEWNWGADADPTLKHNSEEDSEMPYFHIAVDQEMVALSNVTSFYAIMTPRNILPWFEFYITPIQGPINFNGTWLAYTISGNSYVNERMKAPYVDDCTNYSSLGYFDRYDAINSCMNYMSMEEDNTTYDRKIFTEGVDMAYAWGNANRDKCSQRYHNSDCYSNNVFTDTKKYEHKSPVFDNGHLRFMAQLSDKPSMEIRSHEKIANIDFACYFLGAIGTWFGLSFLNINPSILIDILIEKFGAEQVNPNFEPNEHASREELQKVMDEHSAFKTKVSIMFSRQDKINRDLEQKCKDVPWRPRTNSPE